MRRSYIQAAAAACALLTGCARYEIDPDPPASCWAEGAPPLRADTTAVRPGELSGVVELHGGYRRLPEARVSLLAGGTWHKLTLDSAARFRVTGLLPGTYVLRTQRIGLVARTDTVRLVPGAGAAVVLPLDMLSCLDGVIFMRRRPWWKLW
jgi:hypothetical protein